MRSLILVALASVVACGGGSDSPTIPTNASIAGTWTLQSINGTNLPYILSQTGANKTEITSDVLTVVSGGSFTEVTTLRFTTSGQVTTQTSADAGAYVLNGTAVSFQFASDGSVGTGSISGNTLTVTQSGFAYIYKKQ